MTTTTMQHKTQEQQSARRSLFEGFTLEGFGWLLAITAIVFAVWGYIDQYGNVWTISNWLGEFYANISSELLSILITVAVLERLNARRQDKQELTRLKALLASNEAVVAKIAVAELRARGWLQDGSLQGAKLYGANLSGADLHGANLSKADLFNANLSDVNLSDANLSETSLIRANLEGTHLSDANLSGAGLFQSNLSHAALGHTNLDRTNLIMANLSGAFLWEASLKGAYLKEADLSKSNLEGATLPDGSEWTPETDMTRFTDPNHPDFWRPEL